jgi:hypothetical protein
LISAGSCYEIRQIQSAARIEGDAFFCPQSGYCDNSKYRRSGTCAARAQI